MLGNKKIKVLMILADEEAQNPFDSWTKLQLLLNRSKSADGLVWVCYAMHLSHQLVKQWISNLVGTNFQVVLHFRFNLCWIFLQRYDGHKNKHIEPEMLTWRGLCNSLHGKGSIELWLHQKDLRDLLFARTVPSLCFKL